MLPNSFLKKKKPSSQIQWVDVENIEARGYKLIHDS